MPPARAMAIAIRASVTVSIAELTSGTRSRILRVSWLAVSALAGTTSEAAGSSSTSSKVSPSIAILFGSSPPVRTGALAPSAIDMDLSYRLPPFPSALPFSIGSTGRSLA